MIDTYELSQRPDAFRYLSPEAPSLVEGEQGTVYVRTCYGEMELWYCYFDDSVGEVVIETDWGWFTVDKLRRDYVGDSEWLFGIALVPYPKIISELVEIELNPKYVGECATFVDEERISSVHETFDSIDMSKPQ